MLLSHSDIMETVNMISQQHLDIRTITMGITLLDCADPDPQAAAGKIYDKICRCAQNLVPTGSVSKKNWASPSSISVSPSPPWPWWPGPARPRTTSPSPWPWTGPDGNAAWTSSAASPRWSKRA